MTIKGSGPAGPLQQPFHRAEPVKMTDQTGSEAFEKDMPRRWAWACGKIAVAFLSTGPDL
jgi:hypothetical protein